MFDKNETVSRLNQKYKEGDYNGCEDSLFWLALQINTENADKKLYNHELKRILFQTNFIKNPMGGRYKEKDYENIVNILRNVYHLVLAINDPNCDTKFMRKDVVINEGIISDLVDAIAYTDCIYSINRANTERMDTNVVFQQSFAKQIIAIIMYYQDQIRLFKNSYLEKFDKRYVTGMELAVANRPVDHFGGLMGAYLDSDESLLEGINQIILYLFFLNKDKLPEEFDEDIYREPLLPYDNAEFEKYLCNAIQRHYISGIEEGIRYDYYSLVYIDENDKGISRYFFDFEDESKSMARRVGVLRREYSVRSNTIINPENSLAYIISSRYRSELAKDLLELQTEKGCFINLEGFHPSKDKFEKAYCGATIKMNIVYALTKNYYLGLEVGGIKIKDYLIAYGYLCTLSEVVYDVTLKNIDEEEQETFFGELAIVRTAYLTDELSRLYQYEREYSEKLIEAFIFHAKNKHDEDIFADPLVQVSKTQVVLSSALLDQVNLNRSIERLFSRYKKNVSKVGKEFEKDFLKTLTGGYSSIFSSKQNYPDNFAVNNNEIKYVAFDDKEIEFDIVSKLDDYLILTELKAVMASYELNDLENRKENIKEAVKQLHRRKESVKRDWDAFKKRVSIDLPDKPYDDNHIILVACTDSFDYTPSKSDDVYITDNSTYLKYFANPFLESIMREDNKTKCSIETIWENGHPTAEEFKKYLEKPYTSKLYEGALEKIYIPVPGMDENDVEIFFGDLLLKEDPIDAHMKQQVMKKKIYPNDPCPCGSGKKYKKCCKRR